MAAYPARSWETSCKLEVDLLLDAVCNGVVKEAGRNVEVCIWKVSIEIRNHEA